jgi:hypothetical protein
MGQFIADPPYTGEKYDVDCWYRYGSNFPLGIEVEVTEKIRSVRQMGTAGIPSALHLPTEHVLPGRLRNHEHTDLQRRHVTGRLLRCDPASEEPDVCGCGGATTPRRTEVRRGILVLRWSSRGRRQHHSEFREGNDRWNP